MAPSTTRCDDEHVHVLPRLVAAVVAVAVLGCGGQAGVTATDAGTSNKDVTSGEDSGIDFDVLAFDLYVPDVFEESFDAGEKTDAKCVPPDGSCALMTDCCPPPPGTPWTCVLCMQGSCLPNICMQ